MRAGGAELRGAARVLAVDESAASQTPISRSTPGVDLGTPALAASPSAGCRDVGSAGLLYLSLVCFMKKQVNLTPAKNIKTII